MNQQEKELFTKILELQTEIVDILIKIKEIEPETVLNLQPELFAKVDPVADPVNYRRNIKEFLKELFIVYGFNEFNRNDKTVHALEWNYQISDFAKILKVLQKRKIVKFTNIGEGVGIRINKIQFLKQIK